MITTLSVLTKDKDLIGDVNEDIQEIKVDIWENCIVIRHLTGKCLDFEAGDIRIEIDKDEAVKMARTILFALNAL